MVVTHLPNIVPLDQTFLESVFFCNRDDKNATTVESISEVSKFGNFLGQYEQKAILFSRRFLVTEGKYDLRLLVAIQQYLSNTPYVVSTVGISK
jgi:hypothetical protein